MNTAAVLEWELHGPGSHITFSASRDDDGYDLVMKRDDAVVLADVAADSDSLLQKSSRLRSHLQQLGYAAKPAATGEWQLAGGVCWGPAQPMDSSLLELLS